MSFWSWSTGKGCVHLGEDRPGMDERAIQNRPDVEIPSDTGQGDWISGWEVCMVEEIQGWGLAYRAVEGIGDPPGLCGPTLVGCVSSRKLGGTCP